MKDIFIIYFSRNFNQNWLLLNLIIIIYVFIKKYFLRLRLNLRNIYFLIL